MKVKTPVEMHPSVAEALAAAKREAGENDKIVVFGSFLTVADAYG
jgi:folylpolyglutamate synthase/dihydropteroate synthase